jgi:uncharacterized protein (PEP-CTERM system associated)
MTTNRSVLFAASLALLGAAIFAPSPVRADDKDTFDLQNTSDGKGSTLDEGRFDRERFVFTFDTRVGYDSNTLDEPDEVATLVVNPTTGKISTVNRSNNTPASVFFNFDAGVSYTAANPRSTLSIAADAGINYYLDRPGRNYDINGAVILNATYKLTPRASLAVTSYNAYESNPDYGASNLTGFTGQVGTGTSIPGVSDQLDGDYFYTTNHIGLTYQFSPRISVVSSGDLVAFAYEDDYYATIEDRVELYADEQFVYLVQPTLSAVAEYRFGYVDYFSIDSDSLTNYVLGGLDFSFNPRLKGQFRAGVEFRDYTNGTEFDTSPYFQGTLTYDISQRTQASLLLQYDIEEGDLSTSISNARTFRLGLNFNQTLTQRLSAYLSFYFTHADYHSQGGDGSVAAADGATDFSENTFDVAVGLRYSFNRRISAEAGYTYSDVLSGIAEREYEANRCFAGVRFQF